MNSVELFAVAMIEHRFEVGVSDVRSIIDRMYRFNEEQKQNITRQFEKSKKELEEMYNKCKTKEDYENYFFDESDRDYYFDEEGYISELFFRESQNLLVVLMYKTYENALCYAKRTTRDFISAKSTVLNRLFEKTGLEELCCIYNCIKHADSIADAHLNRINPKYEKDREIVVDRFIVESLFESFEKEMRHVVQQFKSMV